VDAALALLSRALVPPHLRSVATSKAW